MEATAKEHEGFNGVIRPLKEDDIPTLRQISEHWLQDNGINSYFPLKKCALRKLWRERHG